MKKYATMGNQSEIEENQKKTRKELEQNKKKRTRTEPKQN